MIDGDMQAISQLIDNLVDNTIKYTPSGGVICVHLSKDQGNEAVGLAFFCNKIPPLNARTH
jgi:signal transduction histidine kinase